MTITATAPDWTLAPHPINYPDAMTAMQTRIASIHAGTAPEQVWLLEHPPLYTAGTSAKPEDLSDPHRFPTHAAGRGGQWTYHGPGQLIAYVMLDLTRPHGKLPPRDTHAYVAALEAWLIAALARLGVAGERRAGRVGIWVQDPQTGAEAKIAAIGVRITRWVTWHGISLNVAPDLGHFTGIIPCGIRAHGVTSLRAQGLPTTMRQARAALQAEWPAVFG